MNPVRLLLAAKSSIFRAVPLMRDARVPFALKASAGAAALLVISPIDIFADVPVLGLLDDVALLSIVCYVFVHFASHHARTQPAAALANIT
jgi:uncharacterized membrane protein YkvA (DUF1232 family)